MKIKEVKRYSERIYHAILKLLPQLGADIVLPSEEFLKGIIKGKNSHLFIASMNKMVVGMLTLGIYDIPSGKKAWIEDVVIDEPNRGKGIGKELVLYAISYSKLLKAGDVNLTSRPDRTIANELYRKMGFIKRETNVYRYYLITVPLKS